jgi:hypothetical protein
MGGKPTEKEALDRFLEEWDGHRTRKSTLEAGLRDARETMKAGVALWLATLGYLVVVEHLGSSIARQSTVYPERLASEAAFKAAALEFSDGGIAEDEAEALYSLRCALGHQYGLRNRRRHIFTLDQVSPLVVLPTIPWDGTRSNASRSQTVVNVREVGRFVEGLVSNARRDHAAGLVALAPGKSAEDLDLFGGLYS